VGKRIVNTPYHAIVWIDHQQAKIFQFDRIDVESATVRSSHPHENIHHKANARDSGHALVDRAFLKQVAEALSDAGTILITGPANAKKELAHYLEAEQPGIAARVAGIEALDHPSDGELLAFARKFFNGNDRMHSQFRLGMHQ
jgi:stalled ribosome rescue protein Dom34